MIPEPIAQCHDFGIDLVKTDELGCKHRPSAIGRKPVAIRIDDIDVARASRNALAQNVGAFINESEQAPRDDFVG